MAAKQNIPRKLLFSVYSFDRLTKAAANCCVLETIVQSLLVVVTGPREACVQSPAVPRRGAYTDGLHYVWWLEIWTGTVSQVVAAPASPCIQGPRHLSLGIHTSVTVHHQLIALGVHRARCDSVQKPEKRTTWCGLFAKQYMMSWGELRIDPVSQLHIQNFFNLIMPIGNQPAYLGLKVPVFPPSEGFLSKVLNWHIVE